MFRTYELGFICRRFLSRKISTPSAVRTRHFVATRCRPVEEKSLIPEHLRYETHSNFRQKFKRFMDSDSAPMLPMGIILVVTHVYVLWYLFGGEFEDDFSDEEVPFLSDFVTRSKALGSTATDYVRSIGYFFLPNREEEKSDSSETDSVSY